MDRILEPPRKRRNREHTNSRNGCAQCKARKVKCDEEKPKCRACNRRNTPCTYSNGGLNQLADAANVASPPLERPFQNVTFTPIQSEVATSPFSNNGLRSEPSVSFTPVQQEFRAITPKSDATQVTNGPPRVIHRAATPRTSPLTLNMGHLELLHHFLTVTSSAIGGEANIVHEMWHIIIPRIALSHDWLMHGILAMSALHIAHLNPEQRSAYCERAAMHQDQALQGQQKAVANTSRDNGDALYAFTMVVSYLAFASLSTLDAAGNVPLRRVIQCLHMLRGMRAIFPAVKHFVEEGPLAPALNLTPGNFKSNPTFREPGTEAHFSRLLIFASSNAEFNEDQEIDDIESYAAAASSLRATFLKVEAIQEGGPTTPPIWHWAERLPGSFVQRLGERHAVPLVLVAHWCVLLAGVQRYWFIRDWVDQTMGEITDCLAPEHHTWLEWPHMEIRKRWRLKAVDEG